MHLLKLLSDIKHSPKSAWVRKYTNLLYYDPSKVNLEMSRYDTVAVDGCKFYMNDQVGSVQRVKDNPWFANIKSTDVVVDLGANIGAITIPLAKVARRVYAVEPLYHDLLLQNVLLNELDNVVVSPFAISDKHGSISIKFANRVRSVETITFSELCQMVGGHIDFLKMDIEGAEWTFSPEELQGIRELRIEFHIRHGHVKEHKAKLKEWLGWIGLAGYDMVVEHPHYGPDPYDAEDWMVRASLEEIR